MPKRHILAGFVRVNNEWIASPTARRIFAHFADPRPAWLWSADGSGSRLLWRNDAARLVNGKLKKSGLRVFAEPAPIKGQIARLIRLGVMGRTSLARVQFLAEGRPLSVTCSCTPLTMPEGQVALLLVGIDPVDAELQQNVAELEPDRVPLALFPTGYAHDVLPQGADIPTGDGIVAVPAGPGGETLVLRPDGGDAAPPAATIADIRAEEGVGSDDLDPPDVRTQEPLLPLGIDPLPEPEPPAPPDPEQWVPPLPPPAENGALSSLFDRLANDADLYSPLTQADETFVGAPPEAGTEVTSETDSAAERPADAHDLIATVIAYADDPEDATTDEPPVPPLDHTPSLWRITGRGFRTIPPPEAEEPEAYDAAEAPPEREPPHADAATPADPIRSVDEAPDPETADRVSRYNFEELGRILTDRVATDGREEPPPTTPPAPGIISLNAETLVLNRLPLAILIFRDQQVLFANRALTDLLGYESVESLRTAGIESIFPEDTDGDTGPIGRLVRRDGDALAVTARLQSVSWQGRAALMLSASTADMPRSHEAAVRAFAELAAAARGEGFLTADRKGVVVAVTAPGCALLARTEAELIGRPLSHLVGRSDIEPLRSFLELPARFAETRRPHVTLESADGVADLTLFAEGQAGIVSGYFGFVRPHGTAAAALPEDDLEPGMLGRVSRGIRRPLNTIIGFADIIRSAALGNGAPERTAEYARDIHTAGLEIAMLADELDDFTRLREGLYAPRPADIDLGALLESCMMRVRGQASAARVLVRSAISERLPRIRADRASLAQALLNLLASAIDQTPVGGSVILSAQSQEDGSIAIHVRDGAQQGIELGERFVVFRDGVDRDGVQLAPVRSSVGLALTRSLLAVNACSLSVDPTIGSGTLFALLIPADAIVRD